MLAALQAFNHDPADTVCVDLGCNVGGFSDCLLQHGAKHIFAVDTGYGALAWTLRQSEQVTVLERQNALHFDPTSVEGLKKMKFTAPPICDLAVIDLGWTRQKHALPATKRWLKPDGRVISLVKPHYEADKKTISRTNKKGVLTLEQSEELFLQVLEQIPSYGFELLGHIPSPIKGGKSKGKIGNTEYLIYLKQIT